MRRSGKAAMAKVCNFNGLKRINLVVPPSD